MKTSKYDSIRKAIAVLAAQQPDLRRQRKDGKRFTGERTMAPDIALHTHINNKYDLMHLYMAYRVLKGKEVTYPTKKLYSQALIDRFVKEHTVFTDVKNETAKANV